MSYINESLLEPEAAAASTPLSREDEQVQLLYSIAISLRGIHDLLLTAAGQTMDSRPEGMDPEEVR